MINNKLSHSINNIAWEKINIIDEDLIIEDYKTSDLTRTELCKKYSISDKKINIILKGIDWRDTPRANKVAQAKTQTTKKHECLTCGETNPDMFGKKIKIRCSACEYKRVKPLRSYYIKKGPKKHECLTCSETNPDMFYKGGKTKCKKCSNSKNYIKKGPKKHECLTCGETNSDMFKFKNKSECKKCCNTKHRINYKSVKKNK